RVSRTSGSVALTYFRVEGPAAVVGRGVVVGLQLEPDGQMGGIGKPGVAGAIAGSLSRDRDYTVRVQECGIGLGILALRDNSSSEQRLFQFHPKGFVIALRRCGA